MRRVQRVCWGNAWKSTGIHSNRAGGDDGRAGSFNGNDKSPKLTAEE
jgi:hypothetical protein